ncbi:MAG: hypothetical protein BWY26_01498 [Elusimicrobia bacterium ADurb.Bin231]|nr:MAG: hypothetical protein BWY26_01498 [Elusimicrobia bacterium ADurb.Bin231]
MKIKSITAEKNAIISIAEMMCAAARTAPKAKGVDNIETLILTEKDKRNLVEKMRKIAKFGYRTNTFMRDADCISKSYAVVLIGTKTSYLGLDCGFCGFTTCQNCMNAKAACAYNAGDLGIAVSSAASVAAAFHIDNRIMYTAGFATVKFKILGANVKIAFGIPLSTTGKNIFFDRK